MEEDEVIAELDVCVTNELDLYLLQFPLKPAFVFDNEFPDIYEAKYKPNSKVMEVSGDETIPKLTSTSMVPCSNIGLGVIDVDSNTLFVTGLKEVIQLRPGFSKFQSRAEVVVAMPDSDDELPEEHSQEPSLEQIQMKRKETDRSQSIRMQSYSYVRDRIDREEWKKLHVYTMDSDQSWEKANLLYGSTTEIMQEQPEMHG